MQASSRMERFGGGAAMLLAVVTVLAALAYVLLPAEERLGVPGRQLLPAFAANPLPLQVEMGLLALMGVIGLAVVRPIRALLRSDDPWLRWASTLAVVGYAVGAVGNTLVMSKLPGIANAFVGADEAGKSVIAVFWRTTLDPWGLWQFGAVGVWLLVVGFLAWRTRAISPVGAYLAVAAGLAHLAFPVLLLLAAGSALVLVAVVAAVVMAGWFAWVGLLLWRRSQDTQTA